MSKRNPLKPKHYFIVPEFSLGTLIYNIVATYSGGRMKCLESDIKNYPHAVRRLAYWQRDAA